MALLIVVFLFSSRRYIPDVHQYMPELQIYDAVPNLTESEVPSGYTALDPLSKSDSRTTFTLSHVYVLTVGTERSQYFEPLLNHLNLEFEIFQADLLRDSLMSSVEDIKHWANTTPDREKVHDLTEDALRGRVGCTLGHRGMWQDMVDHDYETALFMEDDIDVDTNIESLLSTALEQIPQQWQILFLGHCGVRWTETQNGTIPQDGRIWHQLSRSGCSHGYILKRSAAEILLTRNEFKGLEQLQTPWDVHLAHLISDGVFRAAYGFSPVLITQRPRSFSHPSLVTGEGKSSEPSKGDGVERGWRYRSRFPKKSSAAYLAGVSYWHDLT